MADFEQALLQLLRDFTAKVAVTVRQSAMESASAALGAAPNGSSVAARAGRRPGPRSPKAAGRVSATTQPLDADAVGDQVVSYLKAKPGLRTEELSAALQVATDGLKPLIKKLVTGGRLRSEGQARGTRYFPAAGGGAKARVARRKAKAKPGRKRAKKS
jgi:hypothetical protein